MTVFTGSRRLNGSNPDVLLDGRLVPFERQITHLGVVMDMHSRSEPAVEVRTRKSYRSVNGVVGKLGGVSTGMKKLDENCGDATIPNPVVWMSSLGLGKNVGCKNIKYSFWKRN